jgi:hypothetical protein
MSVQKSEPATTVSFFDRRWVKATAFTIGLVSLIFGVWAYYASIREPDVTFTVAPVRTTLVQSGVSSDLTVHFNGQPVSGTVTAVAIGIWNAGRAPVRATDVLRTMELHLPDKDRILSAKVLRQSRDIVNFQATTLSGEKLDVRAQTKLALRFDILERNDFAIFQVIYEGDPAATVSVAGVFVGQHEVHRLVMDSDLPTTNARFFIVLLTIGGSLFMAGLVSKWLIRFWPLIRTKQGREILKRPFVVFVCFSFLVVAFLLSGAVYVFYTEIVRVPPFFFGG